MREDLEQQEQMQNLRSFWKANGRWISTTLTTVLLIVASFNGWKLWKNYNKEKASNILISVEKNLDSQNLNVALRLHKEVSEDYPNTLQSGLAGLLVAKALISDGQREEAVLILRKLTENSQVRWLAIVRLSSVLLDLNRPGEVIQIIPKNIPDHWVGIVMDRRGDAHAAAGDITGARDDWSKALDFYKENSGNQDVMRFISRKLATIGSSVVERKGEKN